MSAVGRNFYLTSNLTLIRSLLVKMVDKGFCEISTVSFQYS